MSQKRRKRREKEVELDYEEAILAKASGDALSAKDDDDLFFIDRGGSQSKKKKIESQIAAREKQPSISLTERRLIEKARSNMRTTNSTSSSKNRKDNQAIVDIWEGDSDIVSKKRRKSIEKNSLASKLGKRSLKILPGHSYNPSLAEHQDALAAVRMNYIVSHN